jgi:hypothetical protein
MRPPKEHPSSLRRAGEPSSASFRLDADRVVCRSELLDIVWPGAAANPPNLSSLG